MVEAVEQAVRAQTKNRQLRATLLDWKRQRAALFRFLSAQLCSPDWPSQGANESPASRTFTVAALTTLRALPTKTTTNSQRKKERERMHEASLRLGEKRGERGGGSHFYDPSVVCNLATVKGSAPAVEHFELCAAAAAQQPSPAQCALAQNSLFLLLSCFLSSSSSYPPVSVFSLSFLCPLVA